MKPLLLVPRMWKWTRPCALALLSVWVLSLPAQLEALPRPFGTGESLTFDVYYGPIKAGVAEMKVGPIRSVRGRDCLHLVSTARSGPVVSTFFKVDDRVESWLDVERMRPLRFEKHLREGRYVSDRVVDFYHDEGLARAADRTLTVSEQTQDALSALYWVRTLDLEPGQTVWLSSVSARNAYDLRVEVTGRERVKTPAGQFDCVVVEPFLDQDGGIFDQKGRLWIWLTDDALRLPVQMVSKVAIGSIKAVLSDHALGTLASGPGAKGGLQSSALGGQPE